MLFRHIIRLLHFTLLLSAIVKPNYSSAAEVSISSNAVVFSYHRVGESRYPSTNITIKQFEAHLAELKSGGYNVLPIPKIIMAIKNRESLPNRTVGISFDDAYSSIYEKAWPRLKSYDFPFTIFISTDPIDKKIANFMTWIQINEMAKAGVTIGSHTSSHLHMPTATEKTNIEELERSQKSLAKALGIKSNIFAYPYGETSLNIKALVKKSGFLAAFGQHSGAFDQTSEIFNLPRFSINEAYAGIERFRLAANTLALQISDFTPADPFLTSNNPPAIGFTITSNFKSLNQLSCFTSHAGQTRIEILSNKRVEIRADQPFPIGRTRLNCTLQGIKGRWHWFGRQFYRPS
jgi:peptidoglycan/xylan/chitin deacetylase (PgdA/CDA1 family)